MKSLYWSMAYIMRKIVTKQSWVYPDKIQNFDVLALPKPLKWSLSKVFWASFFKICSFVVKEVFGNLARLPCDHVAASCPYKRWWPPDHLSQLLDMYIGSCFTEALGMENEEEGYQKDGPEIEKLKVNGSLALLLLTNPEMQSPLWNHIRRLIVNVCSRIGHCIKLWQQARAFEMSLLGVNTHMWQLQGNMFGIALLKGWVLEAPFPNQDKLCSVYIVHKRFVF